MTSTSTARRGQRRRNHGPVVFDGLDAVLRLIGELVTRPRFLARRRARGRAEEPPPLVCFVRDASQRRLLRQFAARFAIAEPGRQVPHALVDADQATGRSRKRWRDTVTRACPPLLPILDELCFALGGTGFGEPIRFDHYLLVDWLTSQTLPPGPNPRASVMARLRAWTDDNAKPRSPDGQANGAVAETVAALAPSTSTRWLLTAAVKLAPYSRFRLWSSGRVPGISRETRWLMKQPYMVPRHSVDFVDFARRLTVSERGNENGEQIRKLLVHAFLQDLRVAYRRRPWHLRGWRRTAWPVAMLDNVSTGNGGWQLLGLLNDVRNETGRLDPLVVLAGAATPPPVRPATDGLTPQPAATATQALRDWRERLPARRRLLAADARYLVIDVPPAQPRPANADAIAQRWSRATPWVRRRPPWPARRSVVAASMTAVLIGAGSWGYLAARPYLASSCLLWPLQQFHGSVAVTPLALGTAGPQCVGYSDSTAQVFGASRRLREVENAVFAENDRARRLHQRYPARPYLGVVYFASLTHTRGDTDNDESAEDELAGLLMRQRQLHHIASKSEPLLRVIVANGGSRMGAARDVAGRMLVPLLRSDHTIVGVVGMERSNEDTVAALTALGEAGVPVVATTMSADGLENRSPLYFGLSPDNDRIAALVARYAGAATVSAYAPDDPHDTYINTLLDDLRRDLGDRLELMPRWRPADGPELPSVCVDGHAPPPSRRILFYGGRADDFVAFTRQVTAGCTDDRMPGVLTDDEITRVVAQGRLRRNIPAGLAVTYLSKGATVVLAGTGCAHGQPDPSVSGGTVLHRFCVTYRDLYAPRGPLRTRPEVPWVSERAAEAYDAVDVLVRAVGVQARRDPGRAVNRSALGATIRDLEFTGVTGAFRFVPIHNPPDGADDSWGRYARSRVADAKNLALITIDNFTAPTAPPHCEVAVGEFYRADQPRDPVTGCPSAGR